ncbi:hypothetical protein [Flavobacterium sp. XGLA_31]
MITIAYMNQLTKTDDVVTVTSADQSQTATVPLRVVEQTLT